MAVAVFQCDCPTETGVLMALALYVKRSVLYHSSRQPQNNMTGHFYVNLTVLTTPQKVNC